MKTRIEVVEGLEEDEIIIRTAAVTPQLEKFRSIIDKHLDLEEKIRVFRRGSEYYLVVSDILFFETQDDEVYAHTDNDVFQVKQRLYEVESMYPTIFCRISKSSIVNVHHILSIERNITSSSLIKFRTSYKQVYVSRFYYKQLRLKLDERRNYEK